MAAVPRNRISKHMPALLGYYACFGLLLLLSSLCLYWMDDGFDLAGVIEKYRGSEEMQKIFASRPDRYKNAPDLAGWWKKTWPHAIAFGLHFFVSLHLIGSLLGHRRWLTGFKVLCYLILLLELFVPCLFWVLPLLAAGILRIVIFIMFIFIAAAQSVLLLSLAFKSKTVVAGALG
ncbi:MAG: hypothetical protein KDK39_06160 [Leptospiraceae bacterium]|nr:hypothetical protein [Leptospiraceae bacterium]